MRIGPFYYDAKEVFLLVAAVILFIISYKGMSLWEFNPTDLLVLTIIFLITKGLLQSIHNQAFFFHALVTVALSIFFPLFQVLIFYFLTFFLFRIVKVI